LTAALGNDVEDIALSQPQLPILPLAKPDSRIDDLVEHRLQPLATRHSAQHVPNRVLLLAQALTIEGRLTTRRQLLVHALNSTAETRNLRHVGGR
jgi:hypothetical protein